MKRVLFVFLVFIFLFDLSGTALVPSSHMPMEAYKNRRLVDERTGTAEASNKACFRKQTRIQSPYQACIMLRQIDRENLTIYQVFSLVSSQADDNADVAVCAPLRLKLLLSETLELQPYSAGSSLRLAALGGSFYRWYAENPAQTEKAKQTALLWGGKRSGEERRQAAEMIRMLGMVSEQLQEEELHTLLCDAGIALPEGIPDKEGFVCFMEALSRVLLLEIFKNQREILNISR